MTEHDDKRGSYRWSYDEYSGAPEMRARSTGSRGLRVFLIILAAVVVLSIVLCVSLSLLKAPATPAPGQNEEINHSDLPNLPEINQETKPEAEPPVGSSQGGELTPREIYKRCKDSVVGVITYGSKTTEGSGIVLSAEGYIITNAHVVSGGQGFEVVLNDGETYSAKLVGADNQTDLALLLLDEVPSGLVAATFGDSGELEVGEMVVAIGNPGGLALASTQTVGYISAVNRTIQTEIGYSMECIQADVAINPGNSGGPLINSYGQVVGITSSKLVEEGYEGIGFSIPINEALPILDELLSNGKVTGRAMLGITASTVDQQSAAYYGIPAGLLVQAVNEDADIATKGVEVGDIITAIDGWSITSLSDASEVLAEHEPGDTVKISVYRQGDNGRARTFEVEIILQGS